MPRFEYKVVPAPRRAEKQRGLKTTEDRFAHTLTQVMNELGRDGWEYQRSDTLPVDERVGFTGSKTVYQNVLVFRRVIEGAMVSSQPAFPLEEPVNVPRLGPAEVPVGAAPALGPANGAPNPGLAAE